MDFPTLTSSLRARQTSSNDAVENLFTLLKNPFNSQLQQNSLLASLGTSIGFSILIAIGFSLLRPYNSVVYAPRLKHSDERHAPPPVGKGVFAWFGPVVKTKEVDLLDQIGLDATVFLRFTRMCRNIFFVLTVIGCGILIPINLSQGVNDFTTPLTFIMRITPVTTYGRANWGQVICAWLFDIVIIAFLWYNYRKVVQLRRSYFNSEDYLKSLHARTLMINDIPKNFRSDEGISRVIDQVASDSSFCKTAVARNVKDLPDLIAQHDSAVRKLEKVLAVYLANPDQLPKTRPEMKPSSKDPSYGSYVRGQKVDAIEYLTGRIRDLELQIKEVRSTIDKRNPMPYGFASYEEISEAHSIAYAARHKHPQKTTIVLAPRPNDVIWKNMPISKSTRRWKSITNNIWVAVMTLAWVAPNIMISIFLANLNNLGLVWPAFQTSLEANKVWWALVQGVASPALTSLIFLLLPIAFRRLLQRAGDRTKTSRERHVMAKLYTFFVFNNLVVFCIFSTIYTFVAAVISSTASGTNAWNAILQANFGLSLFISLCNISPFWITWLLQRNLGAAIDLAQMWTLAWSFCSRKLSNPTPREMIELTAPQAFDYASYYNYFLFYATITLCFGTIQPLVIPAAALYFGVDVFMKKYLLLYIFITKTESGGLFWRSTFNRLIFATILANLVVFMAVFVQGDAEHVEAYAVAPLPFIMLAFKFFCRAMFDDKIQYSTTQPVLKDVENVVDPYAKTATRKTERLAARYGHPALYRPLITPMVHARAQNILASIYMGRLTDSNQAESDYTSVSGYSDMYALNTMKGVGPPGHIQKEAVPGFEVVPENHLDFAYYKNRAEFGEGHGGGEIYGTAGDIDRPGTPSTYRGGYSTPGSPTNASPAPLSAGRRVTSKLAELDTTYPPHDPLPVKHAYAGDLGIPRRPLATSYDSDAAVPLVSGAAEMATSAAPRVEPHQHLRRDEDDLDQRAPGFLGGGPQGYGGLPQHEEEMEGQHDTSYDSFRVRRHNAGWQGFA